MNDCSTSAFEPRQPMTCGYCGNVEWEKRIVRCPHKRSFSDEIADWPGHARYKHRCSDSACENYVDGPDSLQHRYDQLEQVALEMLEALRLSRNSAYGFYRRLLEGLGATVDDANAVVTELPEAVDEVIERYPNAIGMLGRD